MDASHPSPFSWLTDDFIVVSSETSIMSVLDLTFKFRPQYLIITRSKKRRKYEYVIVSSVLVKGIEKILPDPSRSLRSFLKLNDNNSDRSLEVPGYPLFDPEARDMVLMESNNPDFMVLTHKGSVIGIMDPQRSKPRGHYDLKGLNFEGDFFIQMHKYDPNLQLTLLATKYLENKKYSSAETYYKKLVDIFQTYQPTANIYIVHAFTRLAYLNLLTEKYDSGLLYANSALQVFQNSVVEGYNDRDLLQLIGQLKNGRRYGQVPYAEVLELHKKFENSESKLRRTPIDPSLFLASRSKDFDSDESLDEPVMRLPDTEETPIPQPTRNVIKRFAHAMFPSNIWLGESAELIVEIKIEPRHLSDLDIQLMYETNTRMIPVQVVLSAPAFEAKEKKSIFTMSVPVDNIDSAQCKFNLIAREEGWQTILIQFYDTQSTAYLGEIILKRKVLKETEISTIEMETTTTKLVSQLNPLDSSSNLVLQITEHKNWLIFQLLSPKYDANDGSDKTYSLELKAEPEKEIRSILSSIKKTIFNPSQVDVKLKSTGFELYKRLFPPDLQKKFWELKDRIKRIHIFSYEPWIPWEILRPWQQEEGGDHFLCEKYAFTRWYPGKPYNTMNAVNQIKNFEFVAPIQTIKTDDLHEYDSLKNLAKDYGFEIHVDYTPETVLTSLIKGGFNLIHFSAHGKFVPESPASSYILLDNNPANEQNETESRFELGFITGPQITKGFRTTNPLVFLNSCESGSQAYSLNGIGSWADSFIQAGAGAFLGTLWSVTDEAAFSFSTELYKILRFSQDIDLAHAVQQARNNLAKSSYPDPSRFAYTLYAPPDYRVRFGN